MLGQCEDGAVDHEGIGVIERARDAREDPVVVEVDPGPQVECFTTHVEIVIVECADPVVDREQRLANTSAQRQHAVTSDG